MLKRLLGDNDNDNEIEHRTAQSRAMAVECMGTVLVSDWTVAKT